MKSNNDALALIREFEGLRTTAYRDGGGVLTIGYGHTSAAGAPTVKAGMKISEPEAVEILRRDVGLFEKAVAKMVKVPLTENQFGALVSFTFNLGEDQVGSSTLIRKLNAGDYAGAAEQFDRWIYDNGKVEKGLVRRRAAERALFEKGGARPLLKLGDKGSDVLDLQTLLAARGLYRWSVDGDFGPRTDASVRYFQAIEGLTIDGKAGAQVWAALGL